MPNGAPMPQGQPMSQPAQQPVQNPQQPMQNPAAKSIASNAATTVKTTHEKNIAGIVKTVVIVILSIVSVTFIGLFIWMYINYDEARTDVDGQIATAVAEAKDEQATELEEEFLEREKYPYKTFSGPADFGSLTFEYPKTWSVYVESDASTGDDFLAYMNPVQVDVVDDDTIMALRVSILNESFDDVAARYQKEMDRRNSNLSVQSVTIGLSSNITANRYTGTIPNTELSGYIVIFKIRDKTAVLQTDSVLFQEDFDRLLSTVEFNA